MLPANSIEYIFNSILLSPYFYNEIRGIFLTKSKANTIFPLQLIHHIDRKHIINYSNNNKCIFTYHHKVNYIFRSLESFLSYLMFVIFISRMIITNHNRVLNKWIKTKRMEYVAAFMYAAHVTNLLISKLLMTQLLFFCCSF